MGQENVAGLMGNNILENGRMEWGKGKVFGNLEIELKVILVNGKMGWFVDMDNI